jgi:hypothetical protein
MQENRIVADDQNQRFNVHLFQRDGRGRKEIENLRKLTSIRAKSCIRLTDILRHGKKVGPGFGLMQWACGE